MSDNIIESFLGTINTRLRNPFLGSFMAAWAVVNWKMAIVLLSFSMTTIEKIQYIKINSPFWYFPEGLFYYFIIPTLSAAFFTIYFPKFTSWLEKEHINPIEKERLENRMPLAKVRNEIERIEARQEEINNLQEELLTTKQDLESSQLIEDKGKVRIRNLTNERNDLKYQCEELKNNISKTEKQKTLIEEISSKNLIQINDLKKANKQMVVEISTIQDQRNKYKKERDEQREIIKQESIGPLERIALSIPNKSKKHKPPPLERGGRMKPPPKK